MSYAFGKLGSGRYKGNIIYPIEQNNKIGFINTAGKIVIEPEYRDMLFDNEGMIAFLDPITDRWGYMDSELNVVFKPQIKIICPEKFSEGFAGYCDEFKQKWGYIDKYGNVVISPRFAEAYEFKDNYATVVVNELQDSCWGRPFSGDKCGAIDKNGNFVIEPKYDFLKNNRNGLFTARKNDLYGFIDKDNNTIIPFVYENLSLNEFGEGLSLAKYKGKWGVIDINNNIVIDFKIDEILDPMEQCYGIGFGETSSGKVKAYKFDNKWVLFDKNGIPVKTLDGYFVVKEYINGYAMAVTEKEECHIIDEEGKVIFSRKRNYAKTPGPFSEGLAAVNASDINDLFEEKYCYIDCHGNVVIEPIFDSADPFYENYAVVGIYTYGNGAQYGIIDKRGEYLIEPTYEFITRYHNGIALVILNNKYGYVNTSGELIYEPEGFLSGSKNNNSASNTNQKICHISQLRNGVLVDIPYYKISRACGNGNIDFVRDYLLNGGDPNFVPKGEMPMIFGAVGGNQLEIIALLLEYGADINIQDQFGQTALFSAVDGCVDGMIQSGREINNDSVETIKFILSKGADIYLHDNEGMAPLGVAEEYCYQPMIELLKKYANL